MKINSSSPRQSEGSVLVIGLLVAMVLIFSLMSYLSLVHNQNLSVARSQAWNTSLVLAESGVEEALAQLNPGALRTNMLQGSAWTLNGSFYQPNSGMRSLIGGTFYAQYSSTSPPTIYSTGYATLPSKSQIIKRAVEVRTTTAPLWNVGLVARKNITLNGKNVKVDSYLTTDGVWPTYTNMSQIRSNGDIASIEGMVDVGVATVLGNVFLGPNAKFDKNSGGYVSGKIYNDFNLEFPEVLPPYNSSGSFEVTGTYFTNNAYALSGPAGSGDPTKYWMASINKPLKITGNVDLYLSGTGSSSIDNVEVTPGAKLRLYVASSSVTFGTFNVAGGGLGFQYFGLPTNTELKFGGNAGFVGAIYAPNADFKASGGGNNDQDIQGALVVNSIKLDGHFTLHFDERLRYYGPPAGYRAISWREIAAY